MRTCSWQTPPFKVSRQLTIFLSIEFFIFIRHSIYHLTDASQPLKRESTYEHLSYWALQRFSAQRQERIERVCEFCCPVLPGILAKPRRAGLLEKKRNRDVISLAESLFVVGIYFSRTNRLGVTPFYPVLGSKMFRKSPSIQVIFGEWRNASQRRGRLWVTSKNAQIGSLSQVYTSDVIVRGR